MSETNFLPPSFTKKFNGKVPVIKSNLPMPRTLEFARFKDKGEVDLDVGIVEAGTIFHNVLISAMPFTEGVVMMARLTFDNSIQILTEASNIESTNFKQHQKFLKRQAEKMQKLHDFFDANPNSYALARALHPFNGTNDKGEEISRINIGELMAIFKVDDKLQVHDMKNTHNYTFNVTAQDFDFVSFNHGQRPF